MTHGRLLLIGVALLLAGAVPTAAWAKPSEHPFEIVPGSFHFTQSSEQAGAHSDWTTSLDFAHEAGGATYNDARNIVVNLPAGFDASDTAVPTCSEAQLLTTNPLSRLRGNGELPDCPVASQIGQLSIEAFIGETHNHAPQLDHLTVPIYNMEVSSFGVTAQLGYKTAIFTGLLSIQVRPGDTGLTSTTTNIPPVGEVHNISVTIWGLPAAHEHDALRGAVCGARGEVPPVCTDELGGPQEANIPVKPLLANPTSCGTFAASMEAESWEQPGTPGDMPTKATDAEVGPISECDRVQFEPSIEVSPSTRSAESPTGLGVTLAVPQTWENPFTVATSNLKDTRVALPEGMTANPSLAAGLGACTVAQYEAETSSSVPGEGCPPESKIGSIEIETPLLSEKIDGAVYIAMPYHNLFSEPGHPEGSLLALYVVAKDPERGILIKVAGKIEANPVTGQLVTTFQDTPQQPFSRFTLKFRPGATAPLASPPACGTFASQAALTPWSALEEPRLLSSSFEISQGVHEGPCPSGGVPPFHPQATTGTQSNAAGSYSPFYLRIIREDGEQELTRFSTVMPPGLTGNLSGIPFCPDAAIEAAKAPSRTGAQELSEPSCPAASKIGHTTVGAGVGPVLAQNPGSLYLAGPYHGAPLSLVSITSAVVGPFDLGTVVIRFALRINPITAQVEVDATGSDPIPHIIRGIVVHVRDIRAYIDRPNFIINPTSCEHLQIANQIQGANGGSANLTSAFQGANCASLAFKPSFKATTEAKDSFNNLGASLKVNLTAKQGTGGATGGNGSGAGGSSGSSSQAGEANIAKVKVELPVALPSRLTTLQKACTAAQFNLNPAGCPAASNIGYAVVHTPILPVPLEGPAIFVSHGGEAFPSLILVLQGYGITIDLVGTTFISHAGITSSTFKTVPDQPFNTFELTLPTGKFSALAAITNVCKPVKKATVTKLVSVKRKGKTVKVRKKVSATVAAPLLMPTEMVAQNGMVLKQTTKIKVTGCKATKPAKHKKAKRKKGKKK